MKRIPHKLGGWTLMEVVMAMVLLGILCAVVYGKYIRTDANVLVQFSIIKTHLRFAQLKAMNTSTIWGLRFRRGSYWLFRMEDIDRPIPLPGAENAQIDLSTQYGVSIQLAAADVTDTFFVAFDSLGRPGIELTDNKVVPVRNDLNITMTDGTGVLQSIAITAETGFIP